MDQTENLNYNLVKCYKKLTNDPNRYFSDLVKFNNGKIIFDTNIFLPITSNLILAIISKQNRPSSSSLYELSEYEMLCGATMYKDAIYSALDKKPNIGVTLEIFNELRAEFGHWRRILNYLDEDNIAIKDKKKEELFKKLVKFSRLYLAYLKSKENRKVKDLVRDRILQTTKESELTKKLNSLLSQITVKCSDVDRKIILDSILYCLEEPLTLISEDRHMRYLSRDVRRESKSLESLLDTKLGIKISEQWHGFITYLVDFRVLPYSTSKA